MSQKESVETNQNEVVNATIITNTPLKGRTLRRRASLRPRKSLLRVKSVRPMKAVLNHKEIKVD